MRLLPVTPSAWVKWISGGSVVLWVVLAATLNAAQPGDNIEQLLWSSELAWGYAKHPPLTTWMLMGAQSVFGRAPQLTYGLAAACHLATLFLLYRIGSQLLNPQSGIWVLLILSMTYAFTRKAQFYNHNTVLLLGLSLATWLTLQALQGNRWSMWVFQGLSFGLLILAKYQSAIGVFLLYVMVIHATGWRHWKHMCLSTITMLILLMPHIAWLITQDKVDSPATRAGTTSGFHGDICAATSRLSIAAKHGTHRTSLEHFRDHGSDEYLLEGSHHMSAEICERGSGIDSHAGSLLADHIDTS